MSNDIQISEREREILRLVATGATNQQIALQLDISVNTVKVHLRNIFSKIGVVSRTEATMYAIRSGIVAVEIQVAESPVTTEEGPGVAVETVTAIPPRAAMTETDAVVLPSTEAMSVAPADTTSLESPRVMRRRLWQQRWFWVSLGLLSSISIAIVWFVTSLPFAPPREPSAATPVSTPDPSTSRWTSRSPMSNPRDHFAMVAFELEHEIYVIGGQQDGRATATVDRYDPANDRWVTLSDKPTAVSHTSAATLQGKIYVPGGEDAQGEVLTLLEIYDPRERRWERGTALPAPRSRYALTTWEGKLYLIGGWDGNRIRDDVLIYDPVEDSWSEGPPLQVARRHAGATIMGGRLYVFGGENEQGPLRDSIRLDPGTLNEHRWHSIAPLPQAILRPAVLTTISTVLVFDPTSNEFWQYIQNVDAWQSFSLPDQVTVASSAVLLDASIYFVAEASAPLPGAVSEYQAIYSVLLPIR